MTSKQRNGRGQVAVLSTLMILLAACNATPTATTSSGATGATTTSEVASAPATATNAPAANTQATPAAAEAVTTTKLDLNSATGEQLLATLPNFTDRMVREFMEYRPFISIQQFRKEIGKYVDATQVTEWEKYVYVPIQVNDSDAATLQQIPGVDAAVADKLIAARPFADNAAFLATLGDLTSADQAAAAAGYLAK